MDKKRKDELIKNQKKIIIEHKRKSKLWKGLLNKTSFKKLLKEGNNNGLDEITVIIRKEENRIREDIRESIKYLNEIKLA